MRTATIARTASCLLVLTIVSCGQSPHPLTGQWITQKEDPLGAFLVLREDGTFSLGETSGGKRHPGVTGTWRVEGDRLLLRVKNAESREVLEGHEISGTYEIRGDQLTLGALDSDKTMTFHRLPQSADEN